MMRMRGGMWLLLAWAGCNGCDDCNPEPNPPIPRFDARQPPNTTCVPGLLFCQDNQVRRCQSNGLDVLERTCDFAQVCIAGACQNNVICGPGERHCVDTAVFTCNADGTNYESLGGDLQRRAYR